MHIIFRYQGPLSLPDPGQLYLLVTVKVRIEMWKHIFLDDDGLVMRNRDRELQYFH
jgi:hypothetical protein